MSADKDTLCRDKQSVEDAAQKLGLIAMFPRANELTLDIDQPFDSTGVCSEFDRIDEVLERNNFYIVSVLHTKSKSGNTHVWIRFRWTSVGFHITDCHRIALQAALGSDPVREAISVIRSLHGSLYPSALFETPEEAAKVTKWRSE